MHNVWLHRYTVVVAFCTLLLVVAGGLVTSNDAGLSVPDWPLSYG
jgi:cytochrome c oxidase assembly protein subunit 15